MLSSPKITSKRFGIRPRPRSRENETARRLGRKDSAEDDQRRGESPACAVRPPGPLSLTNNGRFAMKLRQTLLTFAAGLALTAGAASAQDFKFPIGEDAEVQLEEPRGLQGRAWRPCRPDPHHLRPVARRGRDARPQRARLFHRRDRRRREVLLLGELRAAGRHRHPGRQPGRHHHPAAARPDRRPRLEGLPGAARRRHPEVAPRQLRRRPVVGRSRRPTRTRTAPPPSTASPTRST